MSLWMRRFNSEFLYLECLKEPTAKEMSVLRVGFAYLQRRPVIRYVVLILGASVSKGAYEQFHRMLFEQSTFQGVISLLDEPASWPKWSKEWKQWIEARRARAKLEEQGAAIQNNHGTQDLWAELRCLERDTSWIAALENAEQKRHRHVVERNKLNPNGDSTVSEAMETWKKDEEAIRKLVSVEKSTERKAA